jgi:hypothetical protein
LNGVFDNLAKELDNLPLRDLTENRPKTELASNGNGISSTGNNVSNANDNGSGIGSGNGNSNNNS